MRRRRQEPELEALVSALRAARSAADVRAAFEAAGRRTGSPRRLHRRAERVLTAASRSRFDELLGATPTPVHALPVTAVKGSGGRAYVISGIAHGQRGFRPGAQLVALVEHAIAAAVDAHHPVGVEPGFGRVFPAAGPHHLAVRGRDVFAALPVPSAIGLLLRLPFIAMLLPFVLPLARFGAVRDPVLVLGLRAVKDPAWIPGLLEAVRLQQLPAAADLELRRDAGTAALGARYSELMAAAAAALGGPDDTVRLIVGAGHLVHLEWLLKASEGAGPTS